MFNFKSLVSTVSVIAATLAVSFSAPALAGNGCNNVKDFAQEIEQVSKQKATVECLEQEKAPAQVPSHEGTEVFIYLAALLVGSWGLVAVLNMNKSNSNSDWDYGFTSVEPIPIIDSSPIIWWEEEIFNPSDLNWEDESPIQWEDLDISTIEWEDLDISDIRWEDEDLSSIIWWEELI